MSPFWCYWVLLNFWFFSEFIIRASNCLQSVQFSSTVIHLTSVIPVLIKNSLPFPLFLLVFYLILTLIHFLNYTVHFRSAEKKKKGKLINQEKKKLSYKLKKKAFSENTAAFQVRVSLFINSNWSTTTCLLRAVLWTCYISSISRNGIPAFQRQRMPACVMLH